MRKDAWQFVQKCNKCQILTVWGVDLTGPLPTAPGGVKFYIVTVDYFTKWIEAEPLAAISVKDLQRFVWKNIICRFGIPRVIVADNGSQFTNKGF